MQTRKKSLSLSELGITVPKRSRTQSHPSPPETIVEADERPAKKSKRSHDSASPPPVASTIAKAPPIRIKQEKPKHAVELSPPPSPVAEGDNKVDVEGISDEIVVGTIRQLEQTGNRPHLVKELAAVLATNLQSIEKSANPSALISSRLTAYLNRPWPAVSPCPLAKDLTSVHPRRLYFYLTTMPRQLIPTNTDPIPKPTRIISPSLSSASAPDEDRDARYDRSRQAMSPSPEVDLSSPELDEEHSEDPYSTRPSVPRERSDSDSASSLSHNRRAASPQLEHEERDFKQTANALYERAQQRRNSAESASNPPKNPQDVTMSSSDSSNSSADASQQPPSDSASDSQTTHMSTEEEEASDALKNSEAAAALFGTEGLQPLHLTHAADRDMGIFSSPVIDARRKFADARSGASHEGADEEGAVRSVEDGGRMMLDFDDAAGGRGFGFGYGYGQQGGVGDGADWDALLSPEKVELAELEDMFDAY